jgi:hypothetical protein
MSMPSSSVAVATTHLSSPDFSASSAILRSEALIDPWCARARTAGSPSDVPDCAGIVADHAAPSAAGPGPP